MLLWTALFELPLLNIPEWGMTLDKVLKSPHGKERCSAALNTRSRFDGVIHFLENVKINSLLTVNSPSSHMANGRFLV